jgi:ankyrin repeat protein
VHSTPAYPNHLEIIRSLARAFDTKGCDKWIDDHAGKWDFDYRAIPVANDKVVHAPLSRYIGPLFARDVAAWLTSFCKTYSWLVANLSLEGISRTEALRILSSHLFSAFGADAMRSACRNLDGPPSEMLLRPRKQAIATLFEWIEASVPGWDDFYGQLGKEMKDRLRRWQTGTQLPALSSLSALFSTQDAGNFFDETQRTRLRALLVLARAVDYYRTLPFGEIAIEPSQGRSAASPQDIHSRIVEECLLKAPLFKSIAKLNTMLATLLRPDREKSSNDQAFTQQLLTHFKIFLQKVAPSGSLSYCQSWHEARWLTLSGKLDRAAEAYQRAFTQSYFHAGPNQGLIVQEALAVTAMLSSPPKTFLRQLRNAQVILGLEVPLDLGDNAAVSSRYDKHLENWFIPQYRSHFTGIFPVNGKFPGAEYPEPEPDFLGSIFVTAEDLAKKPAFKDPNRKIKIGQFRQKRMPQLTYFVWTENADAVKKLLDAGADVNQLSEAGDSALLQSVQLLDVTTPNQKPGDDSFFTLLSERPHKQEVLNATTQKKRLSLLTAAINTNRLDVLRKLLDMGCAPDSRACVELNTPLYYCIQKIGLVKGKSEVLNQITEVPQDQIQLESIRRYTSGSLGMTLEAQRQYLEQVASNPQYKSIHEAVGKTLIETEQKALDLNVLRAIAGLLIEQGADTNAEQNYPIPGYTPLMLAIESDELSLAKTMIRAGGNLDKTYLDQNSGNWVTSLQIATEFQADSVLRELFGER